MRTIRKAGTFASVARVDLFGALAIGLVLGAFVAMIRSSSGWTLSLGSWAGILAIAIGCYFGLAWLLLLCWRGARDRLIPRWILTSFLGSLFLVCAITIPTAVQTWGSSYQAEESIRVFLWFRITDAFSVYLLFCAVSLPCLAAFHYAKAIFRSLERWHNSPEVPRSIVG